MLNPLETQMLPRQAEMSNAAVEMTAEGIAEDKLLKIQDGRSLMGRLKSIGNCAPLCDWGKNKLQQVITNRLSTAPSSSSDGHSQPLGNLEHAWQGHAIVREEAAAVVQMVRSSVMAQPSPDLPYELENGERVSEMVSLSRSVNYALSSELARFKEAVREADNFDRVCHSAFGFSFYSEEFGTFCMLMADTDQDPRANSTQLESFLQTVVSPSKREHMRQMSHDHNLRNQFKELKTSVLKDHLYKIIALVFVNEILDKVPVNYKQHSTELVFESLQLACDVFLSTQLSYHSSNRRLREGIQKLMKNLHLIKICVA
ncbi:uncharacterized protein LOC129232580 isoform X2 [Uloborus diversus]|uniref:uncharacterized protein LOC129232580 isoform X2 n=1 Tax=Uloborus diversus TaxID=327109 RepID=UPI002409C3ED|nr:uncharacterized protein LOC129232580 isoform X2 [Uloborus diversus]